MDERELNEIAIANEIRERNDEHWQEVERQWKIDDLKDAIRKRLRITT